MDSIPVSVVELMSLSGRHALVCGASAGIGRAAALSLASLGARVTVLARSEDRLRTVIPQLEAAGASEASGLVADLEDRAGLKTAVEDLLGEAGPIHVLVNNSGGPPSGPLLEAKDDELLRYFSIHVLAYQTLVRAVLPGMAAAHYGRIINVASTSVREPIPNLGVGNTIRGALAGWAKSLSRELPPGVTINNVLPGYIETERLTFLKEAAAERQGKTPEQIEAAWLATVPEGRLGRPEELGAVIAFLASPAASFIRGVSLPVDGGRLQSL